MAPNLVLCSAAVEFAPGVDPRRPGKATFKGILIPDPSMESFATDDDRALNYDVAERRRLVESGELVNIHVSVEHNFNHLGEEFDKSKHLVVGRIVKASLTGDEEVEVEGEIDTSGWGGLYAIDMIRNGVFQGLSLGHLATPCTASKSGGEKDYNKRALEVSICRTGRRPNTEINTLCLASKTTEEELNRNFERIVKMSSNTPDLSLASGAAAVATPAAAVAADATAAAAAAAKPTAAAPAAPAVDSMEIDTPEKFSRLTKEQLAELTVSKAKETAELKSKNEEMASQVAEYNAMKARKAEKAKKRQEEEMAKKQKAREEFFVTHKDHLNQVFKEKLDELMKGRNPADIPEEERQRLISEANKCKELYADTIINDPTGLLKNRLSLASQLAAKEAELEQAKKMSMFGEMYVGYNAGRVGLASAAASSNAEKRPRDESAVASTPAPAAAVSGSDWYANATGAQVVLSSQEAENAKKARESFPIKKGSDLLSLGMQYQGHILNHDNLVALMRNQMNASRGGVLSLASALGQAEAEKVATGWADVRLVENKDLMEKIGMKEEYERLQFNKTLPGASIVLCSGRSFDRNGRLVERVPGRVPFRYEHEPTIIDFNHKFGMVLLGAVAKTSKKTGFNDVYRVGDDYMKNDKPGVYAHNPGEL